MGGFFGVFIKEGRREIKVSTFLKHLVSRGYKYFLSFEEGLQKGREIKGKDGGSLTCSTVFFYGNNEETLPINRDGCFLFCNGFPFYRGRKDLEYLFEDLVSCLQRRDMFKKLRNVLNRLTGEFSLLLTDFKKALVVRGTLAGKPLFYSTGANLFLVSSERKFIWSIGEENPSQLPPKEILFFNGENGGNVVRCKFSSFKLSPVSSSLIYNSDLVFQKLKTNILNYLNLINYGKVALSFSGGLDSSILAKIFSDLEIDLTLVTVGLRNSLDIENSEKAAELLGLNLVKKEITPELVEKKMFEIGLAMEDVNPLNLTIGTPLFFSAETAKEKGIYNYITGNGADELFGGYKKYEKILDKENELKEMLTMDVKNLWRTNVDRDNLICSFHSRDLYAPYVNEELAEISLNLPLNQKIAIVGNKKLRKVILRKLAEKISLPKEIVNKEKKAIQYGSGSSKIIHKLIKNMVNEETKAKITATTLCEIIKEKIKEELKS